MSEPPRTKDANDRRTPRIPVALELEYRSAGAFLVAYSTNLSRGGLFIETGVALPIGTRLGLKLHAPDATEIEIEGVVAWVRKAAGADDQPPGMGITFETPEARYGAVVDEIVKRFSGIRIAVATGETAPRAILHRYLRSILACNLLDADLAEVTALGAGTLDLAVIDLDSSGEPGALLLRHLRAAPDARRLPIIALAQGEAGRARAAEMGADETIPNPPAFSELQKAVIRNLARPTSIR